ncbi:MAG: M20/M25/M40 family metallo-hydrolase [Pyrinomonadaceae bacterium]
MKRQRYALLLLGSLALGLYAQKADVTEANLRRHIEYLASDKLEGRRTGEAGATLAADYVAGEFTKLKLQPAATGKNGKPGYMQPYPYITGVEQAKTGNKFTLTLTGTSGATAEVSPVGCSPNGSVTDAPVSFAGYGIVAKEANFDDYSWHGRSIEYKGDVIVVFDGTPDNDNPHSPYGRFDLRTKALIAKEHGAVGMLVISREDILQHDRLSRMEYDQSLGEAAVPTLVISRATGAEILGVKESSLKEIETLAADKKDGDNNNVGFRDEQPHVTFGVNLIKKSVDAYNVIGELPGTDPQLKNEAIVIGAHYDHLGHGGEGSLAANSTEIHHGADDNASGTAAIIELARQFAAKHDNKRTLIFIAFSGEEEGLFGSNWYVNHPVFPLDKTIAMINLDMVGRLNENKLTIGGIGTATEFKSLVTSFNGGSTPLTTTGGVTHGSSLQWIRFVLQLSEDGFGPSDHSSFYAKKIPVLFFFTGTHNDYHKPSDTADKINYTGEHQIVDYIQSIIKAVDQNPQRPTYTVAKTAMQGGRSGFNISLGTIPNYADSDTGLLLDGVRDGSPAAKAGVKAGDRVIKLAGHEVRNVMDYTYVLGEMKADVEYEMVVVRGTETLTLKITPVRRQ